MFQRAKYSIAWGAGLAMLAAGMWAMPPSGAATWTTSAGIVVLFGASASMLGALWPSHLRATRWTLGALVALSLFMVAGALVYTAWAFTREVAFWLWAFLPGASWLIARYTETTRYVEEPEAPSSWRVRAAAVLFAAALLGFGATLGQYTTLEPSRSPWLVAPPWILAFLAVAVIALCILALSARTRLAIVGSVTTLFAALVIAIVVYPLGYGFDPFLHQAALDHIAQNGVILPKTLYYLGQYALELLVMLPLDVSAHWIDVALLPALAALTLPVAAAAAVWQTTKRGIPTAAAAVATLALPLAFFINTTPQGFAFLWSMLVFLLALPELVSRARWTPRWVLALLAAAALVTHPLAGLPAVLFVALVWLSSSQTIAARTTFCTIAVTSIAMLPAAFLIAGDVAWNPHLGGLRSLFPTLATQPTFSLTGDLLQFVAHNGWLIVIALAAASALILRHMTSRRWLLYPLVTLILTTNAALLAAGGDFTFLIDYERTNYVDRILLHALLALAPLALLGVGLLVERLAALRHGAATAGVVALVAALLTAHVYTAYPRHDAFTESRGFTVGESDHHVVATIAANAAETPYVVLANQAVSAAAIQDRGFAPYYGTLDDVFYYPVPTGGPLYEVFLAMIEDAPTWERARAAMDLTGVDRVYFVVNEYWWSAEVAVERARAITEEYFIVDDGAAWVFVFDRSQAPQTAA